MNTDGGCLFDTPHRFGWELEQHNLELKRSPAKGDKSAWFARGWMKEAGTGRRNLLYIWWVAGDFVWVPAFSPRLSLQICR